MSEIKVPEGYKQTEVGVIPEDWEVKELKKLLKEPPKYGINAPAVPLEGTLPVYIRITDISEAGYYSPDKAVGVNSPLSGAYILSEGDIVLARTGASVGKSYLHRKNDGVLVYAGFLIKVSPNQNVLNSRYLSQFLKTAKYWDWVTVNSMRSGQPGINGNEYGNLLIPLPSINEQTAIATALSDVDDLIASLDSLIAKKQAIKTGTMQQLLTGKTRLPEFANDKDGKPKGFKKSELGLIPKDWEIIKIANIAKTFSGGTPSTSNKTYYGGEIDWITSSDLNKGQILEVNGKISELGFMNSSVQRVEKDTLLLALYGATAGVSAITRIDATINQAVLAIVPYKDNSEFLFYWLTHQKDYIIEKYTQGGQPNLSGKIIRAITLPLPSKPEQTAIATILSDMNAEIEALQDRLEKTKAIKQGMMQQLLTGRVRLI